MKPIKIGQLGICHEHASGIMGSLRTRPDLFEIVGVVDDRASDAAKFGGSDLRPYEGLPFMTEEELFRVPGLLAVAVEVPNLALVPAALRCLDRNLAIHMDKPGGDDLSLYARLRNGCEERGVPFQIGYMFRNNPAMQWIRRAVPQGWLGEIFEIQAGMSHNYGGAEYQEYLGRFPGGILFNLGCHLIDFVVSVMGRPSGVTPYLKSAPGDADRIKNHGLAVLEYPHAFVTLRACSREINGLERRTLKICGTKGSAELCPLECFDGRALKMNLVLSEGNEEFAAGSHVIDFGVRRDRYVEQLEEFARMIRREMANPYDARHDILVEEVLLAASGYTQWR